MWYNPITQRTTAMPSRMARSVTRRNCWEIAEKNNTEARTTTMMAPSIPASLRRLVTERAQGKCEYCLMHQDVSICDLLGVPGGMQPGGQRYSARCWKWPVSWPARGNRRDSRHDRESAPPPSILLQPDVIRCLRQRCDATTDTGGAFSARASFSLARSQISH